MVSEFCKKWVIFLISNYTKSFWQFLKMERLVSLRDTMPGIDDLIMICVASYAFMLRVPSECLGVTLRSVDSLAAIKHLRKRKARLFAWDPRRWSGSSPAGERTTLRRAAFGGNAGAVLAPAPALCTRWVPFSTVPLMVSNHFCMSVGCALSPLLRRWCTLF